MTISRPVGRIKNLGLKLYILGQTAWIKKRIAAGGPEFQYVRLLFSQIRYKNVRFITVISYKFVKNRVFCAIFFVSSRIFNIRVEGARFFTFFLILTPIFSTFAPMASDFCHIFHSVIRETGKIREKYMQFWRFSRKYARTSS